MEELLQDTHTHTHTHTHIDMHHTTVDILTIELSQVIHAQIRTPNQHKQDAC